MGFEKFGRVSFTAQTKVAEFVDYLEKGELVASHCTNCGARFFPPRADCFNCLSDKMEYEAISGEGTVLSYTSVNYGPTGFENDVPYTLVVADFGGIKVFGRMSNSVPVEDYKVGMLVKPASVQLDNGQISYEFIKA